MHQHWKPGHAEQQLGQPTSDPDIHPLAEFLIDTGTVTVGVALAMRDKSPLLLRGVGAAVAAVGIVRAFMAVAEMGA